MRLGPSMTCEEMKVTQGRVHLFQNGFWDIVDRLNLVRNAKYCGPKCSGKYLSIRLLRLL